MIRTIPHSFLALSLWSLTVTPALAGPQMGGYISSSSCPDNVACATSDIIAATLQPYCSTLLGYTTPVTTTTTYATNAPSLYTITHTEYTLATTTTYSGYIVYTDTTTTKIFAKRAETTPAPLTKYAPSVISSACSLVATPETATVTSVLDGGTSTIETTIAATFTDREFFPTATSIVSTKTLNCGLKGRENRATAYPPAPTSGLGFTSDGSAGIENCTSKDIDDFLSFFGTYLQSVGIGLRENNRTYCDFYRYPAEQMVREAPETAPSGWVYNDVYCPGFRP